MIRSLKAAIWLYLILLFFEGALRKWLLPGLSNPLLIVRDPVLFLIYGLALMSGIVPRSRFLIALAVMAVASFAWAFLAGQTNFWVTLYGIRSNYLHVPLIWIMAQALDREDVERLGSFIVFMAIPMTILMVVQFKSPIESWINRGVGEDEMGQIYGAVGHIRPPGLFTFITGPMVFYPIAAAFFLNKVTMERPRWWWMVLFVFAGLCIAVALPISISRGTMLATALVVFVFGACLLRVGILSGSFLRFGLVALLLLIGLSFLPIFHEAREVFMERWNIAAEEASGDAVGSLTNRVLSGFTQPFQTIQHAPTFGYGIGVGSNVGARLLAGRMGFLLAEDEWGRALMELGPALGIAYILFRSLLTINLGLVAWRALTRNRDILPMLIFSSIAFVVMHNQWAQPTQLGFAVFGAGLLLASVNYVEKDDEDEDDDDEEDDESDESEEVAALREFEERRRRMRGL